jgi:hypothetical protein
VCPGLLLAVLAAAGPAAAQDRAPAPEVAAPAAQEPKPPDGFRVGDFTFKPGGRVKLDIIRDFKPIDNEDSFDTRSIPIGVGDRTNSNLIAKETRLSIDIRGPAEGHELRMYIEGDFYGSGSAFRLRHAYGTWRGLLAGQYWSTFVDEDNLPRTIDFESPTTNPTSSFPRTYPAGPSFPRPTSPRAFASIFPTGTSTRLRSSVPRASGRTACWIPTISTMLIRTR